MSGHTTSFAPWADDARVVVHHAPWARDDAIRFCAAQAAGHYENFPISLFLLGRAQREALVAVYSFARTADDFADEPDFNGVREALLDDWGRQLERCFSRNGAPSHPTFVALAWAVRRFELPIEPFRDLLDAFRQDCRVSRYATFAELRDYCRRSANPVGRIVLRVLGRDDPERTAWSDEICTALQLTNFWQDLSVDLPRGRVYLPLEDLERFGVPLDALLAGATPAGLAELVRFEAERTRALFEAGRPLVRRAGWPGAAYLAAVYLGGRAVLRMVQDTGAELRLRRPALSPGSLAGLWLRAAARQVQPVGRS